jgi:hypothetical protein
VVDGRVWWVGKQKAASDREYEYTPVELHCIQTRPEVSTRDKAVLSDCVHRKMYEALIETTRNDNRFKALHK